MNYLETFRDIAPEFDTIGDERIAKRLALTAQEVTNPNFPDDIKAQLIAHLTAHYLTISDKRKGVAGAVTSVSEGRLSISYSSGSSKSKSDLSATSYGQSYARLLGAYSITPLTRKVC